MLFTVRTLGMDTVYKTTCIHTLKSCKLCTVPKSVQLFCSTLSLFCIRLYFKNSTLYVNEHTFFNCVAKLYLESSILYLLCLPIQSENGTIRNS